MSETTLSPSPLARARTLLDEAGVRYDLVEHDATYSAAEEARAAERSEQGTAKTLVLVDRDRVYVAVIPANRRLDIAWARHALGASRRLRLASEDEAAARFPGYEVGALPPFAAEARPEVIDVRLLYRNRVLCTAGDHRHAVLLDPRSLVRLAEPRVADICKPTAGELCFAGDPQRPKEVRS